MIVTSLLTGLPHMSSTLYFKCLKVAKSGQTFLQKAVYTELTIITIQLQDLLILAIT